MNSEATSHGEILFGGFGKLPNQGDFIRVGMGARELEALEQWLHQGFIYSRNALTSDWKQAYFNRLHHRFVFRPDNCKRTVIGVVRAASDAHSRLYPFTGFVLVPTAMLDLQPTLVPRLHDSLFIDLEARIEAACALGQLSDIQERLREPGELVVDPSNEDARYENFLDEVECQDVGLDARLDGPSLLAELLTLLARVRSNPRQCPVVLELPLQRHAHVRGLELRFWVELSLLALGWYPPTVSFFWPAGEPVDGSGSLLLSFRQPIAAMFGALLAPRGGGGIVWQAGRDPSPFGRENGGGRRFEPGMTLREVLLTVAPGYPASCGWCISEGA